MNNIQHRTDQVHKYLEKINHDLSIDKSLQQINIVLSRLCNRSCVFCPNSNKQRIAEFNKSHITFMQLPTLNAILNSAKKNNFCGTFSFAGFGEPTFHPLIIHIMEQTIKKCQDARINIITNGDNAQTILDLAERYPQIIFTFSEYDEADSSRNSIVYRDIKNKKQKEMYSEEQRQALNNRAGNVNPVNDNPIKTTACYLPFFKTTIDTDGTVLLCDNDWFATYPLGNVNHEDLYDIWRNSTDVPKTLMKLYGRSPLSLCKNCNADGTLYGEEFFNYYEPNKHSTTNS